MVCFYLLAGFLNPFISSDAARQPMARRGHGKSLSERLCASLRHEIIWKWGKGHFWNEVRSSLKGKNKREEITLSGRDLGKARRRPRPQQKGRGDTTIDSGSVAGFPTVLPSIRSFFSMLCRAHPILLCMQWRFRTRPQISHDANPTGLWREEEYTYRETSLSVIWLRTLSPELCVRKVAVIFFPPCMRLRQGRKREYDLDPADAAGSFISWMPRRLLGFGVNFFPGCSTEKEKSASLFIFHKYDGSMHALQLNFLSRPSELHCTVLYYITQLLPAGTWTPNGWIPIFSKAVYVNDGTRRSSAHTSTRFILR